MKSTKTLNCKYTNLILSRCAVVAIRVRQRLTSNQPKVMFLCLGLLDMLVDKCSTPFHLQVGGKEFMQVLITVLNSKELPSEVSFVYWPNAGSTKSGLPHSEVGIKIWEPPRLAPSLLRRLYCTKKKWRPVPSCRPECATPRCLTATATCRTTKYECWC